MTLAVTSEGTLAGANHLAQLSVLAVSQRLLLLKVGKTVITTAVRVSKQSKTAALTPSVAEARQKFTTRWSVQSINTHVFIPLQLGSTRTPGAPQRSDLGDANDANDANDATLL